MRVIFRYLANSGMGRFLFALIAVWTAVLAVVLIWGIIDRRKKYDETAMDIARACVKKDAAYHQWCAERGGVYVPADRAGADAALLGNAEDHNAKTAGGRALVLTSPETMTRQVFDLARDQYDYRGRITSLTPLRSDNKPDEWESQALHQLAKGDKTEVSEVQSLDGKPVLRLMHPVIADETCRKCHVQQDYKSGAVAGGISVIVPTQPFVEYLRAEAISMSLFFGSIWIVGMFGLGFGIRSIAIYDQDRERAGYEQQMRLRRVEEQQEAIHRLSTNESIQEGDFEAAARAITETAAGALHVQRVGLWLVDENHATMHCVDLFDRSKPAHNAGGILEREKCPRYFEMLERRPFLDAAEAQTDPRTSEFLSYLEPLGINSVLSMAIRNAGQWTGVLCIEHVGPTRVWTSDEVNFASQLTDHVALAQINAARKAAEHQLTKHAEELSRSNAVLEQFAYVCSHDLQEPLRTVSHYVQMLSKRFKGRLGSDADDYINYAVSAAQRMHQLINDLLEYSRVDTRGQPFRPVDPAAAVRQAIENLKVPIEETGAVITQDPLPQVVADELQMTQLFQHLIGNAIKFHGPEPPRVHISVERKDGEVVFAVHDNGIGIDPQYHDRIFVIFRRLHSREDYPGTGIGLAISKKIVERHGGQIWVESQEGAGSAFFFSIPEDVSQSPGAYLKTVSPIPRED